MPNKIKQKSHIARLTKNGEYKYPSFTKEVCEVEFTASFNTCYYKNLTLTKLKGGGPNGGNYIDKEANDEYRVSKY